MKIIYVILFSSYSLYAQVVKQDSSNVLFELSEAVNVQLKENPALNGYLEKLNLFLNNCDSLPIYWSENAIEYKQYILQFYKAYQTNSSNHYQVLSSSRLNNELYKFQVIYKLNNQTFKLEQDFYISLLNILIGKDIKGCYYIDLSFDFKNYYFEESDYFMIYSKDKKLLKLLKNKLDEKYLALCNEFEISPKKTKIKYVISNEFDCDFLGLSYSILLSSVYKQDFIINTEYDCAVNLHELTHYVLKDFSFENFISEGLATFFGGTNGLTFNQSLEDSSITKLSPLELENFCLTYLKGQRFGGDFSTLYYLVSAMLIQNYKFKNNINNAELVNTLSNFQGTPAEFILKMLKSKTAETYIRKIVYDQFKKTN